jgi:hypothetical protein
MSAAPTAKGAIRARDKANFRQFQDGKKRVREIIVRLWEEVCISRRECWRIQVYLRLQLRPPPPPPPKRLEEPRLLAALVLAPLLAPPKALPDEEPRLAEEVDALGEALGRLVPAVGPDREPDALGEALGRLALVADPGREA